LYGDLPLRGCIMRVIQTPSAVTDLYNRRCTITATQLSCDWLQGAATTPTIATIADDAC
jgi:hypothetical protein